MSAHVRRPNWFFFWVSLAAHCGVPLVELGDVLLVDLGTLHRRRRS